MRIALTVFAALALCWAAPALAEEPPPDFTKGGVFVAMSSSYVNDIEDAMGDKTWGLSGAVGLRAFKYFGMEMEYEGFGNLSGPAISLNWRAYLPFGRFQPYLAAGGGPWLVENAAGDNRWGGHWRAGGGIDIYINEDWALTASSEYIGGTGSHLDLDLVQVGAGVMYKF